VSDDRLPAEAEPAISEDLRQRGIDVLQELVAGGKVDLDRFQAALDGLLAARTHADFASVVRSLPPPVALTPPAERRQEPLRISAQMGDVRLKGRWQVGRLTRISTGMGSVTIDLTEAEFDEWDVQIVVDTGMGSITVIVPRGLDVRQVRRSAAVTSTLEEPIPGFPVVRLSASCGSGTIRMKHPKEKRQRRWGWPGRRGRAAPRP
jgi:cell wall-active antibiotic response 4TMS protein YvqF